MQHIGHRIKALMEAKKISTKEMAAYCEVTPGAVSNWFSTGRISKVKLARAAILLKTDLAELISGDENASKAEAPQAPTLAATLERLGSLLEQADAKTRDAVAGLLLRYAQDPADGKRLAQAIEVLLTDPGRKSTR